MKAAVNKYTCGILVEPMQGEGGMKIPPSGFLQGLRKIADVCIHLNAWKMFFLTSVRPEMRIFS